MTTTPRERVVQASCLCVLFCSSPTPLRAEKFTGFDDFVARYSSTPAPERSDLARSFIDWQQKNGGFPIIEGDGEHVVFLYVAGSGQDSVRLLGDFLPASFQDVYWDRTGLEMGPISSNALVFFRRMRFESDARLDYEFMVNDEPTVDPLNPRRLFSGVAGREVSELAMPEFEQPAEIVPQANVPRGTVVLVAEDWANPKVRIYLPAAYDTSVEYPVVYTADGTAWNESIGLPTILDNLIADRVIEPLISVMIDPMEDRRSWYSFNADYLDYLEKVVEHVDARVSNERSCAPDDGRGADMQKWNIGGEYAGVTPSTDGPFHVVWSDARSGSFQLWTSRIVVETTR